MGNIKTIQTKELKAQKIKGLVSNHKSDDPNDYIDLLNLISSQLPGLQNLGSFVDIKSIEHTETYNAIAEHTHVKFDVEKLEVPGNFLTADSSSTKIKDYDFVELTHEKIERDE